MTTDDDTGSVHADDRLRYVALSAGVDVRMTGEDDDETTDAEAMKFDAGGSATVTLDPEHLAQVELHPFDQ